MEETRIMRRSQSLQELRHLRRQPIIYLVSRRPQCITSSLWEGVDLQHGVVGRDTLEADIGVPTDRGETARVAELMGETTAFLLLLAADDADLVAELAAFFGEGVDVKGRGFRLCTVLVYCRYFTGGDRGGRTHPARAVRLSANCRICWGVTS